jgi:hypothetical protein
MRVSWARKQLLENFIANPCDETLNDFLSSLGYRCLLGGIINGFDAGETRCPRQCLSLAKRRGDYYLCGKGGLLRAWRDSRSGLLLNLIEFNAYIDSLDVDSLKVGDASE